MCSIVKHIFAGMTRSKCGLIYFLLVFISISVNKSTKISQETNVILVHSFKGCVMLYVDISLYCLINVYCHVSKCHILINSVDLYYGCRVFTGIQIIWETNAN